MKQILIFAIYLLVGCQKKEDLELEIVNKEIYSLNIKTSEFRKFLNSDTINQKAKTKIVYQLTNNSDKTYYFNLDPYNNLIERNSIEMDRAYVSIFDNDHIVKVHHSSSLIGNRDSLAIKKIELLNYDGSKLHQHNAKNFVIHPKETFYFEWFLILPYGNLLEDVNSEVDLDNKKKYYATISLYSEGMHYKRNLSKTDLETIKKNKYEVYNGVITSINKVPIKFR